MKPYFEDNFEYNLIYVFGIPDQAHHGKLKIGKASLKTKTPRDQLNPNSKELNKAARDRIDSYTQTAGIHYDLLWTELAVKDVNENGLVVSKAFSDKDVHSVLKNSGIENVRIDDTTGSEWFELDLDAAKTAIRAVKSNKAYFTPDGKMVSAPIIFRPEQEECISRAVKHFKKSDRFLINAKMRYGKTFVGLEIIKRAKFKKTIIVTHRPVVNEGWFEDFRKIFRNTDYRYGSKKKGYSFEQLAEEDNPFVYFASIQDLRESAKIKKGGYQKNDEIFDTDWDCVIVDEAHEGTQTSLGDTTIKTLVHKNTKLLSLSGTPFNILDDYEEDAIYTWDYVMEQESKSEWDKLHFGDSNPYSDLPELKIYTYDLGDALGSSAYTSFEDKAFNFKEFFRTFTGDFKYDHEDMPQGAHVGDFVHEKDVWSFLNLMSKESQTSAYPFSTAEYRDIFKHTLWMVPGVDEARALSKLMMKHPVFGSGQFEIVNVAGDGNPEDPNEEALTKVRNAINRAALNDTYTITLSCGKLTTGVTVKEWTGVFMLSGSYSTSAANYLQTIFRVQSPANINGKIKDAGYVFDFAPDRTLKMVADAVKVSSKAGSTKERDREILGKFLNYCPVIAISGSEMKPYDTPKLLQQLKRAYAEKVVQHGFDDNRLYTDELFTLDEKDLEMFKDLQTAIGKSKAQEKNKEIDINKTGLTNEEREEEEEINKKKKEKEQLTPEEEARLEELKEKKKNRAQAISILRQISTRMPLLIYGADVPYSDDIDLDTFVKLVDDASWEEFMPNGVTKAEFRKLRRFYDEEIFIAAGRRIRNSARQADTLEPVERVKKIADIFSTFKNPDKETVLTPWRVVNMQLADTIGGWCFFDEKYENQLDLPRYVVQGEATSAIFEVDDPKILDINSKTGLYPLYSCYSVFRNKVEKNPELDQRQLWKSIVENNIFAVCKTPMAKTITKRTLLGYGPGRPNLHSFKNLITTLENKKGEFIKKVNSKRFWGLNVHKGEDDLHFSTIVGNPPYQLMDSGHGVSAKAVYNYFVLTAEALKPEFSSLIMPSRWYAGGKGLNDFRKTMLSSQHVKKLIDFPTSTDVFPEVDISGGVCYFLSSYKETSTKTEVVNVKGSEKNVMIRELNKYPVFIRDNKSVEILEKILKKHHGCFLNKICSARKPFGLSTNYPPKEQGIPCRFIQKIGLKYADPKDVVDNFDLLNKWKFVAPIAPIAGQTDFNKPIGFYTDNNTFILPPGTACTESFFVVYSAKTKEEVENFRSYLFTKTARFLLLQAVVSQHITREQFIFVPDLKVYDRQYTDEYLRKVWAITDAEWEYINSKIK
ncbi:Eco57I restriction-modification methylase domain-containing protein [Allobaculum sp. JKK-2023]|uniref:Eco57I restriction-modification methylase domain-containing protein n=1 Tax=Allobaculum sp. JKK-2023 TaxID=3108943 RepID=UPI002B05FC5C|nr:Eco57I restriction-modification methylase domain-containing protein [Allobaculum sp. JKK-2023]